MNLNMHEFLNRNMELSNLNALDDVLKPEFLV